MARPSKLTPEITKRLTEAIRAGNYYEAACGYAGIHYSTFRKWMQKGEVASWAGAEGYSFRGQSIEAYFLPQSIPSILTNLKYMIVHRGGLEDAKLVRALVMDKTLQKVRSFQAVKYIMETYPNATKFTRQYDIGDRGEWGYLETYLSHEHIDNEARRLHKALGL